MRTFFSHVVILSIIVGIVAAAAGCSDGKGDNKDTVRVITSLPLFADMVQEVGGDRVAVSALLPSGADPHTYEPVPRDVAEISEADVVFVNGLGLEPGALAMIEANLGTNARRVELAEEGDVDSEEPDTHEEEGEGHDHAKGDPHLWMNPDNAIAYAAVIRDQLEDLDPAGADTYAANFEAYRNEIDDAGDYLRGAAATVPESSRQLVTTHDAFGYLAEFLGFEIAAFVATGPGQEPSPDDIRNIVETIQDEGVPAVFTEPQTGGESRTLQQAAEDAGAMVCTLYSDALDETVPTYIDMMRFNADEIRRCLGDEDGG
jgi:zinc/manganese transport system substrate-binding protein/manganese/iron transport system substrate-binding protein